MDENLIHMIEEPSFSVKVNFQRETWFKGEELVIRVTTDNTRSDKPVKSCDGKLICDVNA